MTKKTQHNKEKFALGITGSHLWDSVFFISIQKLKLKRFGVLCLLLFFNSCQKPGTINKPIDSISKLEDNAEVYYSKPEERSSLRKLIDNIASDTLKRSYYFKFSYHFYKENDSLEFRYWNNKTFVLSREKRDTFHLAEAHWDKGNFLKRNEKIDSSFYHYQMASNLYKEIGEELLSARMMLNMGILQQNVKDYTGSEITTSRAIAIIKPFEEYFQLYIGYNTLGISFNGLGEYERSLAYHEKAFINAQKLNNSMLKANTLNNMGVVYKNSGNFLKAIDFYTAALKIDSLRENNIRLFAMLHDNLAYSKMKADSSLNLKNELLFALGIRDSINHRAGIVINKIHLGEYYAKKGDTTVAKKYLVEANNLAKEDNYFRDYLKSLLLLAKIDKENSKEHLSTYIKLDDSLQREERTIRNKFARIRFETDEFIAQNQLLTEQRVWIMGGFGGIILVTVLLFVIRNQQINNKKLQLEKAQQKANEDIYNLLLEQENKIEEGRSQEKHRISRELHDGVLSKIFGTRFVLGVLVNKNDGPSLLKKEQLLKELQIIEEDIRNISHDLGNGGLPMQVGFLSVVEKLLEEQKKITNFRPSLYTDDHLKWEKINNRVKINLYRIIQEAIQNINKYAYATEVKVRFKKVQSNIRLTVADNGRGFTVTRKSQGIGLKNMKSRVRDLEGTMKLSSGGQGTEIIIEIPITND